MSGHRIMKGDISASSTNPAGCLYSRPTMADSLDIISPSRDKASLMPPGDISRNYLSSKILFLLTAGFSCLVLTRLYRLIKCTG